MSVKTFLPADADATITNWSVAQRLVGAFAAHAQSVPDMTLMIDAGAVLNGSTLTELSPQTVGPFTVPTSGLRIDRVVVSRATGVASIIAGTAGSLVPPAIPTQSLPIARLIVTSTTTEITNTVIYDERVFVDQGTASTPDVVCRATLGGTSQTGVPSGTWTRVNLSTTDFNVGSGFDTVNYRFKPAKAGYYVVQGQVGVFANANAPFAVGFYKNGSIVTVCDSTAPTTAVHAVSSGDIIYLNGTTDYVELYGFHNNGSNSSFDGTVNLTFFTALRQK